MKYRTSLVALAALAAASAAQAQQTPAPPAQQPAADQRADDEPIPTANESVVVTGARPVPVTPPERVMTNEQRRRHQAESRCEIAAQDRANADPMRPDFTTPEDVCANRPD
jgi:hypothetical protein